MLIIGLNPGLDYVNDNLFSLIVMGLNFILFFYIADLYKIKMDSQSLDQIITIIIASIISLPITSLMLYIFHMVMIGKEILFLNGLLVVIGIVLWRQEFNFLAEQPILKLKTVIIGLDKPDKKLLDDIRKLDKLGVDFLGFRKPEELEDQFNTYKIDQVIVADINSVTDNLRDLLNTLVLNGINVIGIPEFYQENWQRIPLEYVTKKWFFYELEKKKSFALYLQKIKRLIDIILSSFGLIFTLPLYIPISICIKLNSKGPVFYLQERLGKDGKPFNTIKFRSMVDNAESYTGVIWAKENDLRITRVGKFLRKTRLDELPQFINVLKGEMSLIGPRPERWEFINQFLQKVPVIQKNQEEEDYQEKIPFYSMRLLVKPGITGWAQVRCGYVNSNEGTKEKLEYDLYYIINQSLFLDISILLKTICVVLLGRGT